MQIRNCKKISPIEEAPYFEKFGICGYDISWHILKVECHITVMVFRSCCTEAPCYVQRAESFFPYFIANSSRSLLTYAFQRSFVSNVIPRYFAVFAYGTLFSLIVIGKYHIFVREVVTPRLRFIQFDPPVFLPLIYVLVRLLEFQGGYFFVFCYCQQCLMYIAGVEQVEEGS